MGYVNIGERLILRNRRKFCGSELAETTTGFFGVNFLKGGLNWINQTITKGEQTMEKYYYEKSLEYRKKAIIEEVQTAVSAAKDAADEKRELIWDIWIDLLESIINNNGRK